MISPAGADCLGQLRVALPGNPPVWELSDEVPISLLIRNEGRMDDHLIGGSGNDTLHGSYDRDTLTGDRGSDVFTIKARSQAVTRITDFDPDVDQLVLRGPDWADATVHYRHAGTMIEVGSHRIVLEGVTEKDLSGYDFLG